MYERRGTGFVALMVAAIGVAVAAMTFAIGWAAAILLGVIEPWP